VKRQLPPLCGIALGLLVMRAVDVYWLIAPSGPDVPADRSRVSWMDLPLLAGVGGVWFYVFVAMLRRRPLLARAELDPEEAAALVQRIREQRREGGAGAQPA